MGSGGNIRVFIDTNREEGGFTTISNHIFHDSRNVTPLAGWIFCQLMSLPESWNLTVKGLVSINTCGRTAIQNALRELQELGYLVRVQQRACDGRLGGNVFLLLENPGDLLSALRYYAIPEEDVSAKKAKKPLMGTESSFAAHGETVCGENTPINEVSDTEGKGEGEKIAQSEKAVQSAPEPPRPAPQPSEPAPMPRGPQPLPADTPQGFAELWERYPKKPARCYADTPFEQTELGLAIAAYSRLIGLGISAERIAAAAKRYVAKICKRNHCEDAFELGPQWFKTMKIFLTPENIEQFAPAKSWRKDSKASADADAKKDIRELRHLVENHMAQDERPRWKEGCIAKWAAANASDPRMAAYALDCAKTWEIGAETGDWFQREFWSFACFEPIRQMVYLNKANLAAFYGWYCENFIERTEGRAA